MSTVITQPDPYLQIGTLKLPFPSPDLSVEEVVEMYQMNYPVLADSDISEPRVEGDSLIYVATPPPVKTKGKGGMKSASVGHRLVRKRQSLELEQDSVVVVQGRKAKSVQQLLTRVSQPAGIQGNRLCLPPL